jgi:hypothetical protein
MRLEFEQISGWIVGEVREPGWTRTLSAQEADFFNVAMRGFYKMSAVDVIRDDVDAAFAPRQVRWELRSKHLIVRPEDRPEVEAVYNWYDEPMVPDFGKGPVDENLPTLMRHQLLFRAVEIRREAWNSRWRTVEERPVEQPALVQPSIA